MTSTLALSADSLGILIGLSFFFGLSFEGFYWNSARSRPGGIRTFPLIALSGAVLFALEPRYGAAFCAGLLVLGAWLYPYYQTEVSQRASASEFADGIMVPLCNVVAYLLGPVTLTQPPWVAVGFTVAAVLLLRARDRLHALAERVPGKDIITLAQFLVLIGVILPLLPNTPVTDVTQITPFQVWLAVVVVSSLSYGSYLLQRLVSPYRSLFATSVLGGLYSSTATTVVLARRLREETESPRLLQSGIVLATALMYLRVGIVVAIFNLELALWLAVPLCGMALVAGALAVLQLAWDRKREATRAGTPLTPRNPLELTAAAVFAVLFIVVSVLSAVVEARFGKPGVYGFAAVVGVTDVDPFVLSVAQGAVGGLALGPTGIAILIATSSNNVLKAVYAIVFAGWRRSIPAVASLVFLGVLGAAVAMWLAARPG